MARTVIALRLFLASPSDVSHERLLVQKVVAELNRSAARSLGVFIDLVRWEDFLPGMGRSQQVILDQAGIEESDLFIGIMWNRFGTETGKAGSGTEEEFDQAYNYWSRAGNPRILFYFCNRPASINTEEALFQKGKVVGFKKHILNIGLIRDYETADEFEDLLREHLTNYLFSVSIHSSNTGNDVHAVEATHHTPVPQAEPSRGSFSRKGMIHISGGTCDFEGSPEFPVGDFWIDETPVTNEEFWLFLERSGYLMQNASLNEGVIPIVKHFQYGALKEPDHPVTMVTWFEAQAYATWAGKRLPTSNEWERAARGVNGYTYPWGNDFNPKLCNSQEAKIGRTTPVCKYPGGRSLDGCFDMAGNVFEWLNDWSNKPRFSSDFFSEKMNRGGSFNRFERYLRCWYYESDPPDMRMTDVGFRCAAGS